MASTYASNHLLLLMAGNVSTPLSYCFHSPYCFLLNRLLPTVHTLCTLVYNWCIGAPTIWLEVQPLPPKQNGEGRCPHYDILLPVYLFISRVTYYRIHTKMLCHVHKPSLFFSAFPPLTFSFLTFSTNYQMNWNILLVGLKTCFLQIDSLIQLFLFSICSPVLLSCHLRK